MGRDSNVIITKKIITTEGYCCQVPDFLEARNNKNLSYKHVSTRTCCETRQWLVNRSDK